MLPQIINWMTPLLIFRLFGQKMVTLKAVNPAVDVQTVHLGIGVGTTNQEESGNEIYAVFFFKFKYFVLY